MSLLSRRRSFVGFFGSRSLPSVPAAGGLVSRAVAAASRLRGVAVGCCVGADAAVLRVVGRGGLPPSSSSGASLVVFSAFGPGGAGAWRGSAVALVSAFAASSWCRSPGHGCAAPGRVRWWSGGPASAALVSRLRARSAALVSFVSSCRRPAAVGFVAGPPAVSPGSWAVARRFVAAGVPVALFPVGWPSAACARVSLPGAWAPVAAGPGVWRRALLFRPLA